MLNVFSIGSQWLKQKSCSHCFMYVHTVTGSGYQYAIVSECKKHVNLSRE